MTKLCPQAAVFSPPLISGLCSQALFDFPMRNTENMSSWLCVSSCLPATSSDLDRSSLRKELAV